MSYYTLLGMWASVSWILPFFTGVDIHAILPDQLYQDPFRSREYFTTVASVAQ